MQTVLVLGYYNKKNFGDDLFSLAFQKCVFNNAHVQLANLKDLPDLDLSQFDSIVIGGGDIVNKYYLTEDVLRKLAALDVSKNIIFYSFGLSFPQLLAEGVLDVADFYFPRNKKDTELLQYRFGDNFVKYTPDMTFLLADQVNQSTKALNVSQPPTRCKIGMCLPFPWFANDHNVPLLEQIIQLVVQLIPFGDIFFIPFDTSNNEMNSDIILHDIIKSKLPPECNDKVFFVNGEENSLAKINEYFNSLDVVFASRFHSVIMSILTCTPFISLYASKKIENIIDDMGELSCQFVPLTTNEAGAPVSLGDNSVSSIIDTFHKTISNKSQIAATCKEIVDRDYALSMAAKDELIDIITKNKVRACPPQYLCSNSTDADSRTDSIIQNIITFALKRFGKLSPRNVVKIMREDESLSNILPKTALAPFTQKALTEEILWTITGDPHGPYYYGLYDTILTQKFVPQIKWIISDYDTRYRFKVVSPNITVINKSFYEIHRSGWQYALNNLLSSTQLDVDSVIIDTYVDKTFHWNRDFYLSKRIIPYKSPWIGFIHHTFSDYNNKYNCTELFKNDAFLTSLECCRGLIVMTEYLKKQIISALEQVGLGSSHVPVHVVYHPTEFVTKMFDRDAFLACADKRIVQIGNWLRNVFSIYRLDIPKNSFITQKAILRNRNSDSYFLPDGFLENAFATENEMSSTELSMCRIAFSNMHVKGLFQVVHEMENSVVQIDHLVDSQYDDLLASCVVFVDLVDASAVNTLIECIVRNTPIMINPIEPVVEILGPHYPLYFSSYYEASKLLENTDAILAAHDFLKAMDKTRFKAQTFVDSLENILGVPS